MPVQAFMPLVETLGYPTFLEHIACLLPCGKISSPIALGNLRHCGYPEGSGAKKISHSSLE